MNAALLITTFDRNAQLAVCLKTIGPSTRCRKIILDEGQLESAECLATAHGCEYLKTKKARTAWRCPGFPINIAVKRFDVDIVIITCAEIYHLQPDIIDTLISAVEADPWALAITEGVRDWCGEAWQSVRNGEAINTKGCKKLTTRLPFLMAMKRRHILDIGGYDEDFTGSASEDNDLVDRLQKFGCHYTTVPRMIVHLWHPKPDYDLAAWRHNNELYKSRTSIVRNVGREWGVL